MIICGIFIIAIILATWYLVRMMKRKKETEKNKDENKKRNQKR
jgi:cytochrome bd-type quinol oxidase subunit 1